MGFPDMTNDELLDKIRNLEATVYRCRCDLVALGEAKDEKIVADKLLSEDEKRNLLLRHQVLRDAEAHLERLRRLYNRKRQIALWDLGHARWELEYHHKLLKEKLRLKEYLSVRASQLQEELDDYNRQAPVAEVEAFDVLAPDAI